MQLTEFLQKCVEDSRKYLERGNYFSDQSQYKNALEEYVQSIKYFTFYIQAADKKFLGEAKYVQQKAGLFWLSSFFMKLESCYRKIGDHKNANYFIDILKEIHASMQKTFYDNLDVQELKIYENFSEGLEIAGKNQELTANIQQSEILPEYSAEELDKIAQQIIAELDKCRQHDLCCLKPKAVNLNSSSSDSCFIATAAYSTANHPDLDTFRQFRDEKLLTHSLGKFLVSIYYQIGPSIAHYVEKQQQVKRFLRQQLGRLAEWMRRQKVTSR